MGTGVRLRCGALGILLAGQSLILTSHQFGWWVAFSEWFRRLPLT